MKQIVMIFALLAVSAAVLAHAPSAVRLRFFPDTRMMTLSIDHAVDDPADHYVKKVQIKVNGSVVVSQTFKLQETGSGESLVYKFLDLKSGDVIEAIATCNKGGKNTHKLRMK
jgi:hypothetical protein